METAYKNISQYQNGFCESLSKVISADQVGQKILTLIEEMGYTSYSYIDLKNPDSSENKITNFPSKLREIYIREKLYIDDPVIEQALNTKTPFFSSYLCEQFGELTISNKSKSALEKINELNKKFGLYDLLHIPIENRYLFSVGRIGDSPFRFKKKFIETISSVQIIAESIHSVITNSFPNLIPTDMPNIKINGKPLAVLSELANSDKTISQIADQLCISRITANHHLKDVRTKLGVCTNNAAIKKAILLNLIQYIV